MSTLELRVRQRRGMLALTGRETRRVLSLWTQTILPPILTAILFLAVFGGALAHRIHRVEGVPYLSFILPGLLVMTVAGQAFANCSTSLFQAKNEGYIEDVLTSPLRPWQLALSYMSGGLVRGLAAALAVALLALPFAHEGADPAVTVAALLLTGLVFASLGVITRIDPLYYLVDATRAGLTGFHEASIAIGLAVAAAIATAASVLAVALLARGWRLKP